MKKMECKELLKDTPKAFHYFKKKKKKKQKSVLSAVC